MWYDVVGNRHYTVQQLQSLKEGEKGDNVEIRL